MSQLRACGPGLAGRPTWVTLVCVSAPNCLVRKKQQFIRPFPDKPKKYLLHWPWSSWEPLAMLVFAGEVTQQGKINAGFCRALMTAS